MIANYYSGELKNNKAVYVRLILLKNTSKISHNFDMYFYI